MKRKRAVRRRVRRNRTEQIWEWLGFDPEYDITGPDDVDDWMAGSKKVGSR